MTTAHPAEAKKAKWEAESHQFTPQRVMLDAELCVLFRTLKAFRREFYCEIKKECEVEKGTMFCGSMSRKRFTEIIDDVIKPDKTNDTGGGGEECEGDKHNKNPIKKPKVADSKTAKVDKGEQNVDRSKQNSIGDESADKNRDQLFVRLLFGVTISAPSCVANLSSSPSDQSSEGKKQPPPTSVASRDASLLFTRLQRITVDRGALFEKRAEKLRMKGYTRMKKGQNHNSVFENAHHDDSIRLIDLALFFSGILGWMRARREHMLYADNMAPHRKALEKIITDGDDAVLTRGEFVDKLKASFVSISEEPKSNAVQCEKESDTTQHEPLTEPKKENQEKLSKQAQKLIKDCAIYYFPENKMSRRTLIQLHDTTETERVHRCFTLHFAHKKRKKSYDILALIVVIALLVSFCGSMICIRGLSNLSAFGTTQSAQAAIGTLSYPICSLDDGNIKCDPTFSADLTSITARADADSFLASFLPSLLWPSPSASAGSTRIAGSLTPVGALRIRQMRMEKVELYEPLRNASILSRHGITAPLDGVHHQTCAALDLDPYNTVDGNVGKVTCDGFAVDIPFNLTREAAEEVLRELVLRRWVDAGTVNLVAEYYLFNSATRLVIMVKQLVELYTGGGAGHTLKVQPFFFPFDSLDAVTVQWRTSFMIFLCLYFMVLSYSCIVWLLSRLPNDTIGALRLVKLLTVRDALLNGAVFAIDNFNECVTAALMWAVKAANFSIFVIGAVILYGGTVFPTSNLVDPVWQLSYFPSSYESFAMDFDRRSIFFSVNVLLTLVVILDLVRTLPVISVITGTLIRTLRTGVPVLLAAICAFIAFSVCSFVMFGHTSDGYRTFDEALFSVGSVFWGGWAVEGIGGSQHYHSQGYIVFFNLTVGIIILSCTSAVFNDAFADEMSTRFDQHETLGRLLAASPTIKFFPQLHIWFLSLIASVYVFVKETVGLPPLGRRHHRDGERAVYTWTGYNTMICNDLDALLNHAHHDGTPRHPRAIVKHGIRLMRLIRATYKQHGLSSPRSDRSVDDGDKRLFEAIRNVVFQGEDLDYTLMMALFVLIPQFKFKDSGTNAVNEIADSIAAWRHESRGITTETDERERKEIGDRIVQASSESPTASDTSEAQPPETTAEKNITGKWAGSLRRRLYLAILFSHPTITTTEKTGSEAKELKEIFDERVECLKKSSLLPVVFDEADLFLGDSDVSTSSVEPKDAHDAFVQKYFEQPTTLPTLPQLKEVYKKEFSARLRNKRRDRKENKCQVVNNKPKTAGCFSFLFCGDSTDDESDESYVTHPRRKVAWAKLNALTPSFQTYLAKSLNQQAAGHLNLFYLYLPIVIIYFLFLFNSNDCDSYFMNNALRTSFSPSDSLESPAAVSGWLLSTIDGLWAWKEDENNDSSSLSTTHATPPRLLPLHGGANSVINAVRVMQWRVEVEEKERCDDIYDDYFGDLDSPRARDWTTYRRNPNPAGESESSDARQFYQSRVQTDFYDAMHSLCSPRGWSKRREAKHFNAEGMASKPAEYSAYSFVDDQTRAKLSSLAAPAFVRRSFTHGTAMRTDGLMALYPQRGYFFDIPVNMSRAEAVEVAHEVIGNGWIDGLTRFAAVRMIVKNENLGAMTSFSAGYEIVGGASYAFPFEKFNTQCKIHPHSKWFLITLIVLSSFLILRGFFHFLVGLVNAGRARNLRQLILREYWVSFSRIAPAIAFATLLTTCAARLSMTKGGDSWTFRGAFSGGGYPEIAAERLYEFEYLRVIEGFNFVLLVAFVVYQIFVLIDWDFIFVSTLRHYSELLALVVMYLLSIIAAAVAIVSLWGYKLNDASGMMNAFFFMFISASSGGSLPEGTHDLRPHVSPAMQAVLLILITYTMYVMVTAVITGSLADARKRLFDEFTVRACIEADGTGSFVYPLCRWHFVWDLVWFPQRLYMFLYQNLVSLVIGDFAHEILTNFGVSQKKGPETLDALLKSVCYSPCVYWKKLAMWWEAVDSVSSTAQDFLAAATCLVAIESRTRAKMAEFRKPPAVVENPETTAKGSSTTPTAELEEQKQAAEQQKNTDAAAVASPSKTTGRRFFMYGRSRRLPLFEELIENAFGCDPEGQQLQHDVDIFFVSFPALFLNMRSVTCWIDALRTKHLYNVRNGSEMDEKDGEEE